MRICALLLWAPLLLAQEIEDYWFQDGELGLEIRKNEAYLFNDNDGARYYYEPESNRYIPTLEKAGKKALRFILEERPSRHLTVLDGASGGRPKYGRSKISDIRFVGLDRSWKPVWIGGKWVIREEVGADGYQTTMVELSRNEFEPLSTPSNPEHLVEANPGTETDRVAFTIDLSNWGPGRKTSLLRKIEREVASVAKKGLKGYVERTVENNEIGVGRVMDRLHRDLTLEHRAQRLVHQATLRDFMGEAISALEEVRNLKAQLAAAREEMLTLLAGIRHKKLREADLKDAIAEQNNMMRTWEQLFLANVTAHAEYGIYLHQFTLPANQKLDLYLESLDEKLAGFAAEQLGNLFATQTAKRYGSRISRDLSYLSGGNISINREPGDVVWMDGLDYLLIRGITFLPNLNPATIEEVRSLKAWSLIKERDWEKITERIESNDMMTSQQKEMVLVRVKEKYNYISGLRRDSDNTRATALQDYKQGIAPVKERLYKLKGQLGDVSNDIEEHWERFKNTKKEAQTLYQSIAQAKDPDAKMVHLTGKVRSLLENELLQFELSELGSAVRTGDKGLAQHLRGIIEKNLQKIDQRLGQERPVLKTQLAKSMIHGTYDDVPEMEIRLGKMRVYHDDESFQAGGEDQVMDYVVVVVTAQLEMDTSGLKMGDYEEQHQQLAGLWEEIGGIYENRHELIRQSQNGVVLRTVRVDKPGTTVSKKLPSPQKKKPNKRSKNVGPKVETEFKTTENAEETPDEVPCGSCYEIAGNLYDFKYLDDLVEDPDVYSQVAFGKSPMEVAKELAWTLPKEKDIKEIVAFLDQNKGFPWSLKGKSIYIKADPVSKDKVAVAFVTETREIVIREIYPGDLAYFVLMQSK